MKYGQLIVAKDEYNVVMRNILNSISEEDKTLRDAIDKFKIELQAAKIMSKGNMPDDIIRYDSIVSIRTPYDVERSYQIVAPELSNNKQNKISVLSPIALALFGCAMGDEIMWQFPSGKNAIKIVGVIQKDSLVQNELT